MFRLNLYIKISTDSITVRNIDEGSVVTKCTDQPFSSKRLLVGNFTNADKLLRAAVGEAQTSSFLPRSVRAVIHPLEKIEGGLSQIEDRVLRELAAGAKVSKVFVHIGDVLSDAQVLQKLA